MSVFYWILGILAVLILIYLILIMPRLRNKPDMTMFRNQCFYAHRGLHDNATDAPENSLRAFKKAVEAGYGIEMDVQLTKDKIPVVFHDDTLDRICGVSGTVDSYTYEELQQFSLLGTDQKIPKFADFLKLVDGKVPLIVEHKIERRHDMSVCEIVSSMLDEYQGPYCIESFNPFGVRWYKLHRPQVIRGQLSQLFRKHGMKSSPKMALVFFAMEHLLFNFLTSPDFIAYDCRDLEEPSRKICRSLYGNVPVSWTVKSAEQLKSIRKKFDVYIFEGFIPDQHS